MHTYIHHTYIYLSRHIQLHMSSSPYYCTCYYTCIHTDVTTIYSHTTCLRVCMSMYVCADTNKYVVLAKSLMWPFTSCIYVCMCRNHGLRLPDALTVTDKMPTHILYTLSQTIGIPVFLNGIHALSHVRSSWIFYQKRHLWLIPHCRSLVWSAK